MDKRLDRQVSEKDQTDERMERWKNVWMSAAT